MARSAPASTRPRTSAKPRNISVRAKPPPAKKAKAKLSTDESRETKPKHPDPNPIRTISYEAFTLTDAVVNLHEAYRAIDCLEMLIVPDEGCHEFFVTPAELRALIAAIRRDLGHRIEAVENSAETIRSISIQYRGDDQPASSPAPSIASKRSASGRSKPPAAAAADPVEAIRAQLAALRAAGAALPGAR